MLMTCFPLQMPLEFLIVMTVVSSSMQMKNHQECLSREGQKQHTNLGASQN